MTEQWSGFLNNNKVYSVKNKVIVRYMYIGDLHTHSHYSRATSKECTPEHLDLWARCKDIHIVGSGDFTHLEWREVDQNILQQAFRTTVKKRGSEWILAKYMSIRRQVNRILIMWI